MFNAIAFDKEIDDLIEKGSAQKAEERMLQAYSQLKDGRRRQDLEHVVFRLAHFYSVPGQENLKEAERYFIERETLSPTSYNKYQTATFYFFVLGDSTQAINKIDEIHTSETDRASYYSALCLKGQALMKLERFPEAATVITELLEFVKRNPRGLPFGDEVAFLQTAIAVPFLTQGCRKLLKLVIPKMRSQEYKEKAAAVLQSAEGGVH